MPGELNAEPNFPLVFWLSAFRCMFSQEKIVAEGEARMGRLRGLRVALATVVVTLVGCTGCASRKDVDSAQALAQLFKGQDDARNKYKACIAAQAVVLYPKTPDVGLIAQTASDACVQERKSYRAVVYATYTLAGDFTTYAMTFAEREADKQADALETDTARELRAIVARAKLDRKRTLTGN